MTFSAKFAGVLLAAISTAPFWGGTHAAHADVSIERERLALIDRKLAHIGRSVDELQGIVQSRSWGQAQRASRP
jgi:hypothetical protein